MCRVRGHVSVTVMAANVTIYWCMVVVMCTLRLAHATCVVFNLRHFMHLRESSIVRCILDAMWGCRDCVSMCCFCVGIAPWCWSLPLDAKKIQGCFEKVPRRDAPLIVAKALVDVAETGAVAALAKHARPVKRRKRVSTHLLM